QVDLVYNLAEGKRYRVGRINVKIEGEHTHTRIQTVLNRVSLKPGDIVDIRKLRDSERRLKASGLFLNDPTQGASPRLVIVPPELEAEEELAERPGVRGVRGQSPDNADVEPLLPDDVVVSFGVDGVMYDGVRVSPTLAAPQAALPAEPAPHRPALRQVRELPPPYPVDAPQSHEPLTYRGQSPTFQSPTYQRNPAPRNTVAPDDYPRDPAPVAR